MSAEQNRQQQLDRLVDGELSADERRTLLESLDATPGAWRECAVAFLEAQALRSQFGAIDAEVASPPADSANGQAATPRQREVSSPPAFWWAVAASALIAFGAGTLTPRLFESSPSARGEMLVLQDQPAEGGAAEPAEWIEPIPLAPANAPRGETLTFYVADDQGGRRSFTTRLVDAEQLDRRYGLQFPSRVTPRLRQRFEGEGFHVTSDKRYAPLYLEDGQPFVVPVEDVQIVPVASVAL